MSENMPDVIYAVDCADQPVTEIWDANNIWGDYATRYTRTEALRPVLAALEKVKASLIEDGYSISSMEVLEIDYSIQTLKDMIGEK